MIKPDSHYNSILLIDDDDDDCFLFRQAVSKLSNDIKVHWSYGADHLRIKLDHARPSIIFIDFYLPKITGIECMNQIRSVPGYDNIPVVFWSGSSLPKNRVMAYDAGALYYFEKPCCIQNLVLELEKVFQQGREKARPLAIFDMMSEDEEGILVA